MTYRIIPYVNVKIYNCKGPEINDKEVIHRENNVLKQKNKKERLLTICGVRFSNRKLIIVTEPDTGLINNFVMIKMG